MLQSIREYTQGWIAGAIISIIILTFALWGIHSYFTGNAGNNIVAVVNGVDITKEQLTIAYERLRRQAQSQAGTAIPKDDNSLKTRALNGIVELEVLKQASVKQGFSISDQQVDNYLQSMPEFQVGGQFSLDRFQEILSSTMLSVGEFLDIIRTGLLIDQPRLGVMLTSFALPDETSHTVALVDQTRDINYVTIPLQYFIAQPINITPEQIEAYYKAHQNDFMTPEQVNVEYIELTLKDLYSRFSPTEAMLKNFYNENINSYTQPSAWKLSSILIAVPANPSQDDWRSAQDKMAKVIESLHKGGSFQTMAEQHATVTIPAGMLVLNQVPAELQKAAASLATTGQISDPIRTAQGIVILKADEVREPKIEDFSQVQAKVRDSYVRQHAEEKFAELRDQLADLTYANPTSLQPAATDLGVDIKTSELFTKDKTGNDISQYKKVRDAAFSNEVLNMQNNSDVIQINPETIAVIRVKSHLPSKLLPLKDISAQITEKLKTQEADARAEKFAQNLKEQLDKGGDPTKLVESQKFVWTKLGYIGRYSTTVDSAVMDTAFRLPHPTSGKVVYGVIRLPGGYGVVAVNGVKDGSLDDKKMNVFSEQVQNSLGFLEYALYKNSQMKKAKIKIS
jgi:peptidyl-prolyl cis-trans isomerase D